MVSRCNNQFVILRFLKMTNKEVAEKYIEYLGQGAINQVVGLFTKEGKVHSPVYGTKSAAEFYQELGNDTTDSKLTINGIFEEKSSDQTSSKVALYFTYQWTLKSDKVVEFEVVDIITFNEQHQITELKIIYDTVITRGLVKELKD